MNLENQHVIHIKLGEGIVIEHSKEKDKEYIWVSFTDGSTIQFVFPDAFEKFLTAKEPDTSKQIEEILTANTEKQFQKQKEEKERAERERLKKVELEKKIQESGAKQKKPKVYPRANIAFKCNFCDGGKSEDGFGFFGVCSDEMIFNNIKKEKHIWCSDPECLCKKYCISEIESRLILEDVLNKDGKGFICYESAMLRDWRAGAGTVQTGERKGTPMRLMQVQNNSLAILTTRLPDEAEERRLIFAVFLVDDSYEGDGKEEGYVTTKSKYKIQMKPDEAKELRFWNYYFCQNARDVIKFGSGLHRYISDEQAAQILQDIAQVKKGTEDEMIAQEFFEHFCTINKIDTKDIPPKYGALQT